MGYSPEPCGFMTFAEILKARSTVNPSRQVESHSKKLELPVDLKTLDQTFLACAFRSTLLAYTLRPYLVSNFKKKKVCTLCSTPRTN